MRPTTGKIEIVEDKDAVASDVEIIPLHLASGDQIIPVKRILLNVSDQYIHTKIKTGSKKTEAFLFLHLI